MSIAQRPRRAKIRLGELLIAAGVIDELQLRSALAEQKKWGGKLGRTLVDMGFLTEELMVRALARQLGIPRCNPAADPLPKDLTQFMGVQVCERYGVIPVGGDIEKKVVQLATSDPTNYAALDEIAFMTGLRVEPVVATASSIDKAVRKYYYGEDIVGSRTATPGDLGLRERVIDAPRNPGGPPVLQPVVPQAPPPPPPPQPTVVAPLPPPLPAAAAQVDVAELKAHVERLEGLISNELRALRALVELLVENGLISRDEYLNKVRNPK